MDAAVAVVGFACVGCGWDVCGRGHACGAEVTEDSCSVGGWGGFRDGGWWGDVVSSEEGGRLLFLDEHGDFIGRGAPI